MELRGLQKLSKKKRGKVPQLRRKLNYEAVN